LFAKSSRHLRAFVLWHYRQSLIWKGEGRGLGDGNHAPYGILFWQKLPGLGARAPRL
jgi:hypothetical protein